MWRPLAALLYLEETRGLLRPFRWYLRAVILQDRDPAFRKTAADILKRLG